MTSAAAPSVRRSINCKSPRPGASCPIWALSSRALADFSPLGALEPQLDEPLPLINESIAQITGLDNQLPEFPTLASLDLDPSNAISALESLGIEINDGNTSPAVL